MKKISTLILAMIISFCGLSQDCNIGNEETGPGFVAGNFGANFLLGVKFNLSQVGVLQSLNIIGNGSGSDMQMAIYDDNAGVPNDLVTFTGTTTVTSGIISLPVTPVEVPAGEYWIMAVYNNSTGNSNHSDVNTSATGNVVYYDDQVFGAPIPMNASGFQVYTGQDFLYFAVISCGPLGNEEFSKHEISLSPNPATDFIIFNNLKESTVFKVYDLMGKKLIEMELNPSNNQIDISQLASGAYFLTYNNNMTAKFIKK